MVKAVVFDGDDTLWHTESLYDDARQRAREVVEAAGLDAGRWEELERRIDVENVDRLGHNVERFPTSCMQAYDLLSAAVGVAPDPAVRQRVGAAARDVFAHEAPLVPNALDVLTALRARGYRLALLTKGDPDVQRQRVEGSGLAPLFDVVEIVEHKTPEAIRAILDRIGVEPAAGLSVGNSVRSDALPSLAAGVQPVWIDAHVWEYERDHDQLPTEGVIELDDLNALLTVAPT